MRALASAGMPGRGSFSNAHKHGGLGKRRSQGFRFHRWFGERLEQLEERVRWQKCTDASATRFWACRGGAGSGLDCHVEANFALLCVRLTGSTRSRAGPDSDHPELLSTIIGEDCEDPHSMGSFRPGEPLIEPPGRQLKDRSGETPE